MRAHIRTRSWPICTVRTYVALRLQPLPLAGVVRFYDHQSRVSIHSTWYGKGTQPGKFPHAPCLYVPFWCPINRSAHNDGFPGQPNLADFKRES
jgi:hypothetical protein